MIINYRRLSLVLTAVIVVMAGYIVYLQTGSPTGDSSVLSGVAGASSEQTGFPAAKLNDATPAAWGSDETLADVYAYIVLERPQAVSRIRLSAFTPAGRNHLRDLRLIAAPSLPPDAAGWKLIGATGSIGGTAIGGAGAPVEMISLPAVSDEEIILLLPDKADKNYGAYSVWGVACLRSRGDVCNQLMKNENGMYIREMRLEK